MSFVKYSLLCVFSLALATCKPAGSQNAEDKGKDQLASGAFVGSCQITTVKECWEWYGGTESVAKSKCDLTEGGLFGKSACDRKESPNICKLPFGSSYEILFAYGHQCVGTKLNYTPPVPSGSTNSISSSTPPSSSTPATTGPKFHKTFTWGVCDETTSKYTSSSYPDSGPCPEQLDGYGSKTMGCKDMDPLGKDYSVRWCYGSSSCNQVNIRNQCDKSPSLDHWMIDPSGKPI